ncbi:MAG: hypothetical protein HY615_11040 [Candidatus Rokubacteria bacterium]|nr:hypothetical protein [Candidatus Rokubacteria bacterium]
MDRYAVHVILFQEGERWSAQCLQYDIAAQAKTLPELRYEFERTMVGHLVVSKELGLEPFENLGSAPQRFWDMYLKSDLRVEPEKPLPFRVPSGVSGIPTSELRIASGPLQPA